MNYTIMVNVFHHLQNYNCLRFAATFVHLNLQHFTPWLLSLTLPLLAPRPVCAPHTNTPTRDLNVNNQWKEYSNVTVIFYKAGNITIIIPGQLENLWVECKSKHKVKTFSSLEHFGANFITKNGIYIMLKVNPSLQ